MKVSGKQGAVHFPELPTYLEVDEELNGAPLAGPERALYEMHLQFTGASKSLFLPPNTPDAVYVTAIQAILDNPAYAEENAFFFGNHLQAVSA